ncbi:MAG: Hpt domain-containing protein [Gammaproteobacteria bacterium]|nr:Hpt domain-containing protein [Gammaproteobacteria bacterium]
MKYIEAENTTTHSADQTGIDKLSEETLDMGTFDGMRSVMEDDFNDLIEAFYQSSEEVFRTMDGWTEWGSEDEYRRYPHSLKSIAGNIGAMSLKELAAQCEAQITDNSLAEAQATYALIREEYQRVRQQLDSLGFAQAS